MNEYCFERKRFFTFLPQVRVYPKPRKNCGHLTVEDLSFRLCPVPPYKILWHICARDKR